MEAAPREAGVEAIAVDEPRDEDARPLGRRLMRAGGILGAALLWIWTCGALHYFAKLPALAAWLMIVALPVLNKLRPRWRWATLSIAALLAVWMLYIFQFKTKPRTQRLWWEGNRKPPIVRFDGKAEFDPAAEVVSVHNVRHFKWRTREDFEPSWVTQTYYLDKLDSLDLIVEPLKGSRLFAHTMLSFGFGPERRVVVSIEARRERGERFGLIGGLYKQFEIFYQVNDERDALTLRAIRPDSHLYVFPVKATPEFMRELFLDMMREASILLDQPEFYHSLKENCTTKLFEHMNGKLPEPLGFQPEVLFPSRSGELLHRLGWMDTELDYEEAEKRFRLVDKVREFAAHPDFSKKIRE